MSPIITVSFTFILFIINPTLSETISCGSASSCSCTTADTCELQCDNDNECLRTDLHCTNGQNCRITCGGPGDSACIDATVYANTATDLYIDCDEIDSCENMIINAENLIGNVYLKCGIDTEGPTCEGLILNAPLSPSVTIDCDRQNSCTDLNAKCGTGTCTLGCNYSGSQDTCNNAHLQCNSAQCRVNCVDGNACDTLFVNATSVTQPVQCFGTCNTYTIYTSAPTNSPTTNAITTAPTTDFPTTSIPTTSIPTTSVPTTFAPTVILPTTHIPTTSAPTTALPTTLVPTTVSPTTNTPTDTLSNSNAPTTTNPTGISPSTSIPTTSEPTQHEKDGETYETTKMYVDNDENKVKSESIFDFSLMIKVIFAAGLLLVVCICCIVVIYLLKKRKHRQSSVKSSENNNINLFNHQHLNLNPIGSDSNIQPNTNAFTPTEDLCNTDNAQNGNTDIDNLSNVAMTAVSDTYTAGGPIQNNVIGNGERDYVSNADAVSVYNGTDNIEMVDMNMTHNTDELDDNILVEVNNMTQGKNGIMADEFIIDNESQRNLIGNTPTENNDSGFVHTSGQ